VTAAGRSESPSSAVRRWPQAKSAHGHRVEVYSLPHTSGPSGPSPPYFALKEDSQ
jgi:hypothetical protein